MLYEVKSARTSTVVSLQLNGQVCTLSTRVVPFWDTVFPHPHTPKTPGRQEPHPYGS